MFYRPARLIDAAAAAFGRPPWPHQTGGPGLQQGFRADGRHVAVGEFR
jgi:hypothetical protein